MTKTGAMINIVMTKAFSDKLLKQIRFFVGTFGRTKTRDPFAVFGPGCRHAISGDIQGLIPTGFAEMRKGISRINIKPLGWCVFTADKRFG